MRDVLNENAWRVPATFRQTITAKELEKIMLEHDGQILARGEIWKIKYEQLSPTVFRIWLEKK